MTRTAKLFKTGRSQAVRLPKEFRFEGTEVEIKRDPVTGGVLLLDRKAGKFEKFFELLKEIQPEDVPEDFPWRDERKPERDDPLG